MTLRITEVQIVVCYRAEGQQMHSTAVATVRPPDSDETLAQAIERATKRVRLHLPEQLR